MKRFLAKIGGFFWSWGFLECVLALIVLVVLLYIEEDWRGAHDWAVTKAKWEAKGESFDFDKFIPRPVPDGQNIAALPLFRLEPFTDSDGVTTNQLVNLRRALRDDVPNLKFIRLGNWQMGELPDMARIREDIVYNFGEACKGAKPPGDAMAQFDLIYPFFSDFIADAATRPVYRVNLDYTVMPPFARPLGPVTKAIHLSQILTLHAILASEDNHPDLSLQDIETNFKLVTGSGYDPTLVGGLVGIGVAAIGHEAIYDGLVEHVWSDSQMAELEQTLMRIDFLAGYQFAMRGEVVQATTTFDYLRRNAQQSCAFDFTSTWFTSLRTIPWPGGWWDENKCGVTDFRMRELAAVDPKARLVSPMVTAQLQNESQRAQSDWTGFVPWKILATVSNSPLVGATIKFAEAQVWVDEARIACGLERYRLARGVYPGTLGELAPGYIDEVPHDIMNGEAYHYRANGDGTFLLYSVGWNQTDEGGKVAFRKENPKAIDYEQGDWVWPAPKYSR